MDKVDGWKFSQSNANNGYVGGYSDGYAESYTQRESCYPPCSERIKITDLINNTLSGIGLLIALVSVYGIILYVLGRIKKNYAMAEKGKYKISLGLPSLLILFTVPFSESFLGIELAGVFFVMASLVSGIIIFIVGAKKYIKYKLTDPIMKKRGITQMLFMILIFAVLMIYAVAPIILTQIAMDV